MSFVRLESMRDQAARCAEALPCLPLLLGLLNGSIWMVASAASTPLHATLATLPGLALAALLLRRGRLAGFAVCTLLGLASAHFNSIIPQSDYTRAIGGRAACGAVVEARVVDESCCGDKLPWLPNPKYVKMEALRLSPPGTEEWREVSGSFAARLPEGFKPEYGERVRLEGAFLTPETPASEAAFDFGRYLELRSIRRVFDVREAASTGPGTGFMHALLNFRGIALKKLCEEVPSDEGKRLVAALSFGCQQGISWESRADFLRSGAIHILSVSGLHIAMVATILALALRFLPFRARYLALPALTLLYSLMTGMQAPSFRAFAMLAVWSVLRAALLATSAMNSVLLAAALLLLWRPAQMLDTGFQYSFITVILLIGSAGLFKDWRACARETFKWVPAVRISSALRLRERLLEIIALSLASCVVAWLASCGLSLLYQGLGVPSSIPANMALIPVTWGVFMTLALQALLFWVPGFLWVSGAFMDWLLRLMNGICAFFASGGGGHAPMPPAWSVAAFLAMLLALVLARSRRPVLCAAFAVAATLALWSCGGFFMKPTLAVLHGGQSQEPSVLLSDPRSGFAIAVNVPDFDSARQLAAHLNSQGMDKVDFLLLSSAAKDYCGGAKNLMGFVKVDAMAIPEFQERAVSAAEAVGICKAKGADASELDRIAGKAAYSRPFLNASLGKNAWTLECQRPGMDIVLSLSDAGDGVRLVEAKAPDGRRLVSARLCNSLEREMLVFELERR